MPDFSSAPMLLLLTAALSYLLGSIPFGIVITRALGLGDLRKIGSGNIGATNVLRTGNKPAALATLLLDAGKGGIAVLFARALVGPDAAQVAGLFSFLGHLFPVWLGFKGGKGVATFLGTLIALAWPVGVAACATWAVTAAISRISSLSALVAAALTPVWLAVLGYPQMTLLAIALGALIFARHSTNIARLRTGTEPRIGRK
ncbi:MAG: glycerol-3-phosphate 1-O-acyltransferase PlsY [Pseudotabrizicola sp.]|uniref:glycerol-3-phosphate 1-O-acyltransferase PlsY n=1 Tax=Pseudotabrizicola sp. TaxID=2939647 RepID=UPI002731A348|nr:glycerol-3-phosphate 1-O-acyltransferase PlsY [Pseudotabrizicola sp.]MDP2079940.1 glycerol-3-phosphate 1-O-acyltransferase PlsY [Pseudotabrizicola sp.]MDZ7575679.1 glycerol-3-phosphate 1-O-acyltransferase PlsY [Pseudotabrizicola sp.]